MKNLHEFDEYRQINSEVAFFGYIGNDKEGMFIIPYNGAQLKIIASSDFNWDHVSVSCPDRVPTYEEMKYIKRQFFRKNEIAIEYHMPEKDHINNNPNVLHLWRPQRKKLPIPPKMMV